MSPFVAFIVRSIPVCTFSVVGFLSIVGGRMNKMNMLQRKEGKKF